MEHTTIRKQLEMQEGKGGEKTLFVSISFAKDDTAAKKCGASKKGSSYLLFADFERLEVVAHDAQLLLQLDDLTVMLQGGGKSAKVSGQVRKVSMMR